MATNESTDFHLQTLTELKGMSPTQSVFDRHVFILATRIASSPVGCDSIINGMKLIHTNMMDHWGEQAVRKGLLDAFEKQAKTFAFAICTAIEENLLKPDGQRSINDRAILFGVAEKTFSSFAETVEYGCFSPKTISEMKNLLRAPYGKTLPASWHDTMKDRRNAKTDIVINAMTMFENLTQTKSLLTKSEISGKPKRGRTP